LVVWMLANCWRTVGELLENCWRTAGELLDVLGSHVDLGPESTAGCGFPATPSQSSKSAGMLENCWKTVGELLKIVGNVQKTVGELQKTVGSLGVRPRSTTNPPSNIKFWLTLLR
jgi:hypothetical protein